MPALAIGHRNAVAVMYGFRISGVFAWFLWRGVYLAKLPTITRKLEVALSWFCSIPFPPNIVQLSISRPRLPKATNELPSAGA